MSRTFEHAMIVTIRMTNMEGNVYWLQFLEMFGDARELFLLEFLKPIIPDGVTMPQFLVSQNLSIGTSSVDMKFKHPAFYGDELVIRINVGEIQLASCELKCEVVRMKDDTLIAIGTMHLVFENLEGKVVRIPEVIKTLGREYQAIATPMVAGMSLVTA